MKKITFLVMGLIFSSISFGQQTITHSNDPANVTPGITVACPTENTAYQRTFDFENQFGITGDFEITTVEFGLEISEVTQEAQLRLAVIDNVDPTEDLDADAVPDFTVLSTLFEGPVAATTADEGTVISFDLPAPVVVPAGGILLFEIGETADGVILRIGANQAGETAPSYLFSDACGFGSVDGFGFDNDYVMNVIGDDTLSVNDNLLSDNISIFPNPTNGDLNLNINRSFGELDVNIVNVNGQVVMNRTVDTIGSTTLGTSRLANGVYFAQITSEEGTATLKFIKN